MNRRPSVRVGAARVIAQVLGSGRTLDRALPPVQETFEDRRDRALLQAICYGVLRFCPRLECLLDELLDRPLRSRDIRIKTLLLAGLYQLGNMDVPDEIIQHGYLHVGTEDSGPLGHRLLSKFFTRQNAEFLNADYEHARSAIESGQQIMKDANLSCTGFTSPTWHQSKETEKALSDCGFLYYTSYSRVISSQKEMRVHSSALGDLGLSSFLSQMNMVKNEFMATTGFRCSPLARIVLHPQTPFESPPFSQALNTIVKLAGKRRIVTYRRFVESL